MAVAVRRFLFRPPCCLSTTTEQIFVLFFKNMSVNTRGGVFVYMFLWPLGYEDRSQDSHVEVRWRLASIMRCRQESVAWPIKSCSCFFTFMVRALFASIAESDFPAGVFVLMFIIDTTVVLVGNFRFSLSRFAIYFYFLFYAFFSFSS